MSDNVRPLARCGNVKKLSAEQGPTPGSVFRDARRRKGYSTEAIADACGVTERTVRRWQSNATPIDLLLLIRHVPEVGLEIVALLGDRRAA